MDVGRIILNFILDRMGWCGPDYVQTYASQWTSQSGQSVHIPTTNVTLTPTINEDLRHLYSSPSIIRMIKSRRMRWAGNVARMGEKRNSYRILVGRPKSQWVDNIKMDLREIGWDGMDWIDQAQDMD
jgi:hypothetical protein